ncbi:MAG: hypothetical protein N4A61_02840 [Pelagimonas sp.]|nr:hypothetical protein [Pelagimonas sp.]
MSRSKWHIQTEEGALTLARSLPVRFDVSAQVMLPRCSKRRLAMQIRQDMWRLLQNLRGFSPIVRVEDAGDMLRVTAGGRMDQRAFPKGKSEEKLRDMLAGRQKNIRWVTYAGVFCYE